MQQGAGAAQPQSTFAQQRLQALKPARQIGTPHVTAVDYAQRQHPVSRQLRVQCRGVVFAVHQIDMQTLYRQRFDNVQILADAVE